MFDYEHLINRNIGIFTESEQKKIANLKILLCGCGVGSNIAALLVRTGFENITIIDGDIIELSNLNRQNYRISEIGKKKVLATRDEMLSINPNINLRCIDEYLVEDCVDSLVKEHDIVIDTIDFSALRIILSLHESARSYGKFLLSPINLGWGSGLYVFNESSIKFEELIGINKEEIDSDTSINEDFLKRWSDMVRNEVPNYLIPLLNGFLGTVKEKGWCPVPQIGLSTFLTASLTVGSAVCIALQKPIKLAPEFISLDIFEALNSR